MQAEFIPGVQEIKANFPRLAYKWQKKQAATYEYQHPDRLRPLRGLEMRHVLQTYQETRDKESRTDWNQHRLREEGTEEWKDIAHITK